MPALALVGVASGIVARSAHVAGVELDPFRPGAAERVAADHVAEDVDDVSPDIGGGGDDQEPDEREGDRDGSVGWGTGTQDQRDQQEQQRDDHQRRVGGRADACRAVCVGVVGGAGDGRGEHEQDRRHERDIGGGRLVQEVKDDDQQERADRDVRCGRVERVAQPGAVEEVLERADRVGRGRSASDG